MTKTIKISKSQAQKFNEMLHTLKMIAGTAQGTHYMTPEQLRRSEDAEFLGEGEVIEMAYDNIQGHAKQVSSGVRFIQIDSQPKA